MQIESKIISFITDVMQRNYIYLKAIFIGIFNHTKPKVDV